MDLFPHALDARVGHPGRHFVEEDELPHAQKARVWGTQATPFATDQHGLGEEGATN